MKGRLQTTAHETFLKIEDVPVGRVFFDGVAAPNPDLVFLKLGENLVVRVSDGSYIHEPENLWHCQLLAGQRFVLQPVGTVVIFTT